MNPERGKVITLQPAILPAGDSAPVQGWLRAMREGQGLSRAAVAVRLGVTRATVQDFEEAEVRGAISLASLRRVAAALDCEVVMRLKRNGGATAAAKTSTGTRASTRRRSSVAATPAPPPAASLILEYREPGTGGD